MLDKRQKIANSAFVHFLNIAGQMDGELIQAVKYESGWVNIQLRDKETNLKYDFTFSIDKETEKETEDKKCNSET